MTRSALCRIHAERIALVKPSALGDIVHALPVLEALRLRFPRAHITWIVQPAYAPLLIGHPALDAVLYFDRPVYGGSSGWLRAAEAIQRLWHDVRRAHFDLVIDLQGLLRSGLLAVASGARTRIGLADAREGARWCYTHCIPTAGLVHAVDRYWSVAEALGVGHGPKRFRVPIPAQASAQAEQLLAACRPPYVAIHPGARWETKRWPLASFLALAERIHQHVGGTIVWIGSVEEARRCQHLLPTGDGHLSLVGKTPLPLLAALLHRCHLVVSNDSGPLHLAAALGRPVLAPFLCTRPERNGPYGQRDHVVVTRVPCAGSLLRHCPLLACQQELTVDRLWPVAQTVLLGHRQVA
ncbi:MAG: glycosyltransferase family 9 protein [Gemmataceae bacterium]